MTTAGQNTFHVGYRGAAHGEEDDKGKYKLVRLRTLDDFSALEGEAKAKALVVKKLAEDKGEYLGKKLTKDRCTSLRKTLGLKYLGK